MMKVTKYVLEDLFDQYNKQFFDGILVKTLTDHLHWRVHYGYLQRQ